MLVREMKRGRLRYFAAAFLIGLTLLLLAAGRTADDHNPSWAFLFALACTAFLVGCSVALSQAQRRRVFRAQLPPGLEVTTRFGPDYLVMTTQWAEVRTMFDAFASLEVERGWVILLQRQRRVRSVFPQELFPADDLARLRMVIAGYQPRPPAGGTTQDAPAETDRPEEPEQPEQPEQPEE
jgi:hypothetical protein